MDLTGKIVARGPEAFTLRELREMTDSRAWQVYSARLEKMASAMRQMCAETDDPTAWRGAQGALKALVRAQQIPEIIEQELGGRKE